MDLISRLLIITGKIIQNVIKISGLGAGETWPGEIILRIKPDIISLLNDKKVIFVSGTNGKTTTAKLIEEIFVRNDFPTIRNKSGANLDNGVVSTMLSDSSWTGMLRSGYFVIEVDEAALPILLQKIVPETIVLLNLFRDQLDRYGEVDIVSRNWLDALKKINKETRLVINADDPSLVFIGEKLRLKNTFYFGLNNSNLYQDQQDHATDAIFCLECGSRFVFDGIYFSHLGKWKCTKCGLSQSEISYSAKDISIQPIEGIYNKYNLLAAICVSEKYGVHKSIVKDALKSFQPAFGRMEEVEYKGKNIKILLSKNPTGFNQSLKTLFGSKNNGPLLIALNDNIADGRDVSWIWDVDFEMLERYKYPIFVSGTRCRDMGVRLKYTNINKILNIKKQKYKLNENNNFIVESDLKIAIDKAVEKTQKNQTLRILPTYTAMLEARKILLGRKIL